MAYDNTIPATGHSGSQDYNGIRGNFQQIQNSFTVNHEPLGSGGATEGFHTQVQYAAGLGGDPNLSAPIASLYTKGNPANLFFQNGNMASNVTQLTGLPQTLAGNGYVILPGGLIIQWGKATGSQTISFPLLFPAACFSVVVSPLTTSGSAFAVPKSPIPSGFIATTDAPGRDFNWIAVGN